MFDGDIGGFVMGALGRITEELADGSCRLNDTLFSLLLLGLVSLEWQEQISDIRL